MAFKTEYVVESAGNYSKTYEEIRVRNEKDDQGEKVLRIEQGQDTILISEDQIKDFMEIVSILNKP